MNESLTKKQIERQDFVDNEIFNLATALIPDKDRTRLQSYRKPLLDWDIELIGAIREAIEEYFVENGIIDNEMEFYPYLEEE